MMRYIQRYLLPVLIACVLGGGGTLSLYNAYEYLSAEKETPVAPPVEIEEELVAEENQEQEEIAEPVEEETEDPYENVSWSEAGVQTNTEGVVNILLVGRDAREDEADRSDSMILVSINKNSQQVTMISFMRDLFVEIEGYNSQKINAAYFWGGAELLTDTIKQNFDVDIDYTVEVNFSGFQGIIDAIGGIEMEINETEASYLRGETGNFKNGKAGYYTSGRTYDVEAGTVQMDGQMALDYARMRHAGNSDYERTLRQRKLLIEVYEKAKTSDWLSLIKLYNEASKYIETDMSMIQIFSVGYTIYTMDMEGMNSYRIPANGMFEEVRDPTYGDVLVISDPKETNSLIWNYLYSDDGGKSAYQQLIQNHGEQEALESTEDVPLTDGESE